MKKEGDHEGSEDHQTKPGSRIPDLEKMNAEREEKMARFRFAALIKYLYKLKGYKGEISSIFYVRFTTVPFKLLLRNNEEDVVFLTFDDFSYCFGGLILT